MATVTNSTKTLAQVRSLVYFITSESPSSRIFTSSVVNDAINMGLNHVWALYNRASTLATSATEAAARKYQLPQVQSQRGKALVDKVWVDGEEISPVEFTYDDGTTGKPTEYYVDGIDLCFNPTPDAEYQYKVQYHMEHPTLTDSDTSLMPDLGVDAAIQYACYILKLKDEQYSAADRFKAEYEDLLKQLTSLQSGVYKAAEVMYGGAV